MKKLSCVIFVMLLTVSCLLSSCSKGETGTSTAAYKYNPSASTTKKGSDTETETETADQADGNFTIDSSWQSNYTLTYSYTSDGATSVITESRTADKYLSSDQESGTTTYLVQNGSDVDQYLLYPESKNGAHKVYAGKNVADISTGFMKISTVDSGFNTLPNVVYVGEEKVAGRDCKKDVQRAYTSGQVTGTAYIYIDKEFGFAIEGQQYDSSMTLTVSWEVTSFATGSVSSDSLSINTEGYSINEES